MQSVARLSPHFMYYSTSQKNFSSTHESDPSSEENILPPELPNGFGGICKL